ncbi:Crp/Fnr family transcriptional regulator [Photobacterium leiognathi]|uniref:Crp/Fnr family transcriptional regulator n=1 Tax=Photobacterium leiognathi TaxID=553611 RepID=A0ABX5GEB2_PHOLE|nr:Crp/Fnr family transcriptional regulator [Photobacterium leiognathi]KJF89373.1 Crp/Fnr family transcriptional regulator [Photobacterium leiognathi]PSV80766.1 Crp/Fnr family transcriptional regulator [Photobacterium leiognathi]
MKHSAQLSQLAEFLQQFGAEQTTIDETLAHAQILELPTRHILLNQGQQAEQFYFLLDGLCHACYLTENGKQFSKEFYWDQDALIGFEGLITQSPSPFLLETLSTSQLIALPIALIETWRAQGLTLYINLLERQLVFKENKERFMLMYSPEERYQLFTQSFAELNFKLTDYQIASYLGITPISLSRIKKRQAQPQ